MSIFSRDRMPSFVEVSYVQPSLGDPRDQARYFWLWGKKMLGFDPFEMDRWADDGGCIPDSDRS